MTRCFFFLLFIIYCVINQNKKRICVLFYCFLEQTDKHTTYHNICKSIVLFYYYSFHIISVFYFFNIIFFKFFSTTFIAPICILLIVHFNGPWSLLFYYFECVYIGICFASNYMGNEFSVWHLFFMYLLFSVSSSLIFGPVDFRLVCCCCLITIKLFGEYKYHARPKIRHQITFTVVSDN